MLLKLIKKMTIPAIKARVFAAEKTGIISAKAMRVISTIKSGIISWRVVCPPIFKPNGFSIFFKRFFSERAFLAGKTCECGNLNRHFGISTTY